MINEPPISSSLPVNVDRMAVWTKPWANWVTQAWIILFDLSNSGVTANRPTKNLYTGKFYFDTTLGLPIWYKTAGWVKADGTAA